jgi:hypothetical protein
MADQASQETATSLFDKTLTQQGEQRSPFAPNHAESKADCSQLCFWQYNWLMGWG